MEKQEFLMEITELSRDAGASVKMKEVVIHLMKETITQLAKAGSRQYQVHSRLAINMGGINISLPISSAIDYFREQGFNIIEVNNYWLLSW